MSIEDEYSTIMEAKSYLGVTRQSISRWIREGILSSKAFGRVKLIKNKDLRRLKYEQLDEKVKNCIHYGMFVHFERKKRKYGRIMTIKDLDARANPNENFPGGGDLFEILWENGRKSKLITAHYFKRPSEDNEDVIVEESQNVYQVIDI
jgi:excisionase family DNA binding protein